MVPLLFEENEESIENDFSAKTSKQNSIEGRDGPIKESENHPLSGARQNDSSSLFFLLSIDSMYLLKL